jgi:membrane protein
MRCAAIGAGLAAVAWELGKWGFTFVVLNSTAQTLYGAIALIPLFLLWVYITWIVVLSGLQISYVLQHFRTFAVADDARHGAQLVEPLTLVRIALLVAERFVAGQKTSLAEVSSGTGLDQKTALSLLERMTDASVLHRVPEGDEHEEFALARPAEQIRLREVLELGAQITSPDEAEREPEAISRLREAQLDATGHASLAELLPQQDEGDSLSSPE